MAVSAGPLRLGCMKARESWGAAPPHPASSLPSVGATTRRQQLPDAQGQAGALGPSQASMLQGGFWNLP